MRTDDLISALARGDVAVPRHAVARRYAAALVPALLFTFAAVLLLAGPRPDLAAATAWPMLWIKFAFPLAVALAALAALMRLSRPGVRPGGTLVAVALPVIAMWLFAAIELAGAPPQARPSLWLGDTWQVCAFRIATVAVPAFAGSLWALKGLAPTRPALAGGVAGLVAGALGAFVYAFHCPEMAASFLGTWYVAGMLIPAAAGAMLGPRLLRW
jgi:hypothetical protein